MNRGFQILLIASTAGFSWLGMMAVHELGHVLHAWLSGGTVVEVLLHPAAFSRTDVLPNPHPQFVAWGGAVWGCLIPLALWLAVRLAARPHTYLAAFFAGFCLIANGFYLAVGALWPNGDDAGAILKHGGDPWQPIAFGIVAVVAGFCLWHGLGPNFGLGSTQGKVDRRAAVGMAVALVLLMLLELVLGG